MVIGKRKSLSVGVKFVMSWSIRQEPLGIINIITFILLFIVNMVHGYDR